ncbi:hypothetical protein [Larkinella terrae]|uniref:Uncharacterized protein n=1 Tax=Larkinella terrae TaxID=2025311 RepID=A0A7K0ERA7_9BACT|nr:hypothetical protein [Larkinella terrae]MRS64355.1 hypothetical protein [Larkinella terrae]
MKNVIGILAILLGLAPFSFGQKPTRLHFLNTASTIGAPRLRTTRNLDKDIKILKNEWTVVQTDEDSLGIVFEDRPYYIHLNPGKSYYFVISTGERLTYWVREVSESEFLLNAHFNRSTKAPEYRLGAKTN